MIPAVDILDGRAVRLERGDFGRITNEAGDPVGLVRAFAARNPPRVHVVLLDGAREGSVRLELVRRLVAAARPVPLQLGGGVRSPEDAFALLEAGVARVIVGTAALEQGPDRYVEALGPRLAVAVDVRGDELRVRGWERSAPLTVDEAVTRFREAGVPRLVCTAVERDGTLEGPDLDLLARVLRGFRGPVVAAGGVRSNTDVAELQRLGLEGAIVGRAMLDGQLELGSGS